MLAPKLPAFCDRSVSTVRPPGPVSVKWPATVAWMVDGDEVLVFSTRMSLVMAPALTTSTSIRLPKAGSNLSMAPARLKLVAVAGMVNVLVIVCTAVLTVASWSNW